MNDDKQSQPTAQQRIDTRKRLRAASYSGDDIIQALSLGLGIIADPISITIGTELIEPGNEYTIDVERRPIDRVRDIIDNYVADANKAELHGDGQIDRERAIELLEQIADVAING